MPLLTKTCKACSKNFAITNEDLEFYKKIGVPAPTLCNLCRQQRRLSFRNELNLYKRKCDFSGAEIVSMYSSEKKYKIYDQKIWWSDNWDAMKYGKDFDFSKPFFEQFAALQKEVPRMSLNCIKNENSEFTNYAIGNKNSYLVFTADYNEDSLYGRFSDRNFHCMDFDFTYDSTHCYETINTFKCNMCHFSQKIEGCSNLYFCYDMKNCHDCIACANLRSKRFYVFNEEVSKEEYEKIKLEMNLSSYEGLQKMAKSSAEFLLTCPKKYLENMQCEDCVGNYIKSSKNAKMCFDSYNLHDVKFGTHLFDAKDCYDWDFVAAGSELCYEMVSCAYKLNNCKFTMNSWEGNADVYYCDLCLGDKNLFGCIGLRHKEYCILNKQYEKDEYKNMVKKIIDHMEKTNEWGEFFPASLSPFGYNESVANEYFPITREEAMKRGFNWKEPDKKDYTPQKYQIPDELDYVPDGILKETLACAMCGKNYRIIPQELALYRIMKVAIPRKCFLCRHADRMTKRNPRKLWEKSCSKCKTKVLTTYPPENKSPVYCEKCYMELVY